MGIPLPLAAVKTSPSRWRTNGKPLRISAAILLGFKARRWYGAGPAGVNAPHRPGQGDTTSPTDQRESVGQVGSGRAIQSGAAIHASPGTPPSAALSPPPPNVTC